MSPSNAPYVSLYVYSQESDWGVHAKRGGTICTSFAVVGALLRFIWLHWVTATLSLCIGLVLATFEVSFIYQYVEVRKYLCRE